MTPNREIKNPCPVCGDQIDSKRWLVLDPQDPAVVERIAAALSEGRFSSSLRAVALAVIAALGDQDV